MTDKITAMPRCAVIFNPTKISDDFRATLDTRLGVDGWENTLWLETAEDDAGYSMIKQAVEAQVDLVIGAGGDGTIRILADGLADSGIPMGIVPSGTGNLLARNLDLPLQETDAIDIALGRHTRAIDLVKLTVDDKPPEHFAVMAGVGVDSAIMDETNPKLKETIGSAAYFIAAAKALGRLPMDILVTVDGRRHRRRHVMLCLIGNVGKLTGNITLIPQARPDDGMVDIYVASPHRFTHWLRVALRLITGRKHTDDQVDLWRGRHVEIRLRQVDNYQLDGDVSGAGRMLTAEVRPGALQVRVAADHDESATDATAAAGSAR
jgi:diacylglycerol kinase (ATP)